MASEFELLLWGPDRTHLEEVAQAASEEIDALERQLSAYFPTSDVCWLNRTAPHRPARVEPGLFRLLQRAERVHAETEGAFDVTVGPLVKCWGFFRRQGRIPPADELATARDRVGMHHVHLDPTDRSVSFDREGVEINLGGIGKGYAVQRVIDLLRRYRVDSAFVHVGHSSIAAFGVPPLVVRHPEQEVKDRAVPPLVVRHDSAVPSGWRVGLRHPRQPEERLGLPPLPAADCGLQGLDSEIRNPKSEIRNRLGVVRLRSESLSASGDYEQFFEVNGRIYSHILDPRTGAPAQGTWSAWAKTPDSAWADALSTAFFVLGAEGTRRYCQAHEDVGAALVPATEGEPELICIGKMEIE
jgi:thiamine biosynthesis lipoprotein